MRFSGHSTGTVGKIMKMGATKWAYPQKTLLKLKDKDLWTIMKFIS